MANVAHSTLTGSDLHEPKGVASANSGQIYIADGAGSGTWTTLDTSGRWELISTATASNSSTLTFTGFDPALYRDYKLVFDQFLVSTISTRPLIRTSTNGGSSYDSGASDYAWLTILNNAGASSAGSDSSDSAIAMTALNGLSNNANEGMSGELTVFNPGASSYCRMSWNLFFILGGLNQATITGSGQRKTAADVNALEISMTSGTITSGVVRFYGLTL